jgi:hypothetical protein
MSKETPRLLLEVEWIGKENEMDWIGVEKRRGDW